ncbi:ARM repeat-containing protein [Amniculicola lignicola CBS 123094]|uniref:Pumilio homology domain family member 3 n=1 Tax=Amniculicola lignicola CBS 123094 TaxID=1392246 RepID=A0A6A5W5U7_9PLEO|nr:ARM repeat-containing protein [Amniculicola lignicola CBS 123094]
MFDVPLLTAQASSALRYTHKPFSAFDPPDPFDPPAPPALVAPTAARSMDTAPGGAGRTMGGLPNNVGAQERRVGTLPADPRTQARTRDFPGGVSLNGADSDRATQPSMAPSFGTTTGWGSIWNTSSLGAFAAATARDSSRPRGKPPAQCVVCPAKAPSPENTSFMAAPADPIPGKTGSGSLVASSESDDWNVQRKPWGENTTHVRSSGVSPARKRSIAQAQPAQQYVDSAPASTFFPRTSTLGQGPVGKPGKSGLDPTTMNFSSARQAEPLAANGFSSFAFASPEASSQREASVGSWTDNASVHSPTDDRRSIAASEYFGPSSNAPSRSGSLPPSRHGAEPQQFAQSTEHYPRFAQPGQRQNSSFSYGNGRAHQERSGSIQSDIMQSLSRMSIDQEHDVGIMSHRPSISVSGVLPGFNQGVSEQVFSREAFTDMPSLARGADHSYIPTGTYTPDTYGTGHLVDPAAQFRSIQFDTRSAPSGTAARQSPYMSSTHTPPVYDHLYPSRNGQALTTNEIALLQNKLQYHQQQQQERRNYVNAAQYPQAHYQHVLVANQLRNPYNQYQYGIPNGTQMNGLAQNIPIQPVPGMMAVPDAPRAPRDYHDPVSVMSDCLNDFKNNAKTNKRYELKDIYTHIVEFSGDQHGSRFIQQKLENANSDEKDKVFKELERDSLQLMQDVFGNYVIQKFFEHGDQVQKRILANRMKGHVAMLSNQMYGCRVVQKALEHVLTDQQAMLVKELEKDVLKCVKDQNGNHVIQKAIERVPMESIQFIIQAFKGQVGALAVHAYGCRVIQRMLEHVEPSARRFILQELHAEGPKLISDQYGNYVTQHIIEHGEPEDRAKIIALIKAQLLTFSKHKFASNVVERCLVLGTDEQRREIMLKVAETNERGDSNIMALIKDGYGNYVIQKLLDTLSRQHYEEFMAILKPEMELAKRTISGKQVAAVEKKMHRFERNDSVSSPTTQRSSIGSDLSTSDTPALTSDAQSPRSSSLPSTNTSTVDEPVHTSLTANKELVSTPGVVNIANA